jgi:hypothetical protein
MGTFPGECRELEEAAIRDINTINDAVPIHSLHRIPLRSRPRMTSVIHLAGSRLPGGSIWHQEI